MLVRLPWHRTQWQQIEQSCQENRLPHAILLSGPQGIGLNTFAENLAQALLCFSPVDAITACDNCKSCELFKVGNHPDHFRITPEEKGKQIKVGQIRELIEFINLKSQYQKSKIVVITPAEAMNRAAANTLLKTLEEPPDDSVIVLVSYRPDVLPITIRSRCQRLYFQPDYSQSSIDWLEENCSNDVAAETLLQLAHGAPLAAVRMLEEGQLDQQTIIIEDLESMQKQPQDLVKVAEKWNAMGASQVMQWLLYLIADMIKLKSSALPGNQNEFPYSRLQQLVNRLNLYKLMQLYDLTLKNYGLGNSHITYNSQGLLEEIIIHWQYETNHTGGS